MASSPLELYERAYRLHYVENRIPEAVIYYNKLIKEFPDANECGYAVIQLQKIKAQSVTESLSQASPSYSTGKQLHPIVIICLVLLIGELFFTGIRFKSFTSRIDSERNYVSTALNALGKIARQENEEALQLLSALKQFDPKAIAPYELSADIYRKQNQFIRARNEYVTYFKKNPDIKPTQSEITYMKSDTPPKNNNVQASTPPSQKQPISSRKPNSPSGKKKTIRKRGKLPPPPSPAKSQKTKKTKKSIYLIDPDSVSYF